jgi:hypothetical protein
MVIAFVIIVVVLLIACVLVFAGFGYERQLRQRREGEERTERRSS